MTIYLYVKQHSVTGLKYFGKTTRKDPFKYPGSGKYWLRHINKYGNKNVKTLELWGFDNIILCTEFALKFSKENNIVESDTWANLIDENGRDGFPNGNPNPSNLDHNKNRMKYDNPMSKLRTNGGTFKKGQKPIITLERNEKIRLSKLGENNPNYGNPNATNHWNVKVQCSVCGSFTNKGNLARWHNEKCRPKS